VAGLLRVAATSLLTSLLVTAAQGADVPRLPPPSSVTPPPATGWSYSGWYVRGDLGYRFNQTGDVTVSGAANPTDDKLKNVVAVSGGIGLKSSFLRADVTADLSLPARYTGSIATPDDTRAKIRSASVLLNGYLDLGTWYGLTPYVGAGAGGALVKVSDVQGPIVAESNSRWNFAWAGMTGVAWTVAPNLQIDFGYRYLHLGKGESGGPNTVSFNNIGGHEARVGLRWHFNDLREFN
jgi:opacity protein-like surface antigen